MQKKPVIVAITGASGIIYGVRTLEVLKELNHPSIAVMSSGAILSAKYELGVTPKDILALATETYHNSDLAAPIASGGLETHGMIIAPCSVKTLSSLAHCYSNNLISRAADVTLKERRPLIALFRETPLHLGHIQLMEKATLYGAIMLPPVPAFYTKPQTLDEIVNSTVSKALDLLTIENTLAPKWKSKWETPS